MLLSIDNSIMREYKICGIATKVLGIKWFMLDNLRFVGKHGFKPCIICSPEKELKELDLRGIEYIPLDIKRGYSSPFQVISSIVKLCRIFRQQRFDIIQYTSSNAALFASIAGWLSHIPIRIYCQWGMAYSEYKGIRRLFYRTAAKITCLFSTTVQPDSFANLNYAVKDKLYPSWKGNVIHKGSASGVNLEKFSISHKSDWRSSVRKQLTIPEDHTVFGFVGRLVRDKGLNELFEAFMDLDDPQCTLLIVGPFYDIKSLNPVLYDKAVKHPRIIFVGSVNNAECYYAAMDFFVLPSYREGFGSVVIEAAALAVPSICSNIKGPTDFVKDGYNGLLCDVKSAKSLNESFKRALSLSPSQYQTMSYNAYETAKNDFDADLFKQYFLKDRLSLLEQKGII